MQKQLSPQHGYEDDFARSPASFNQKPNPMLSIYTSTVLKILPQAVEEIKRGMVLIKNSTEINNNIDRINSVYITTDSNANNDSVSSTESAETNIQQPQQTQTTNTAFDSFDRTLVVVVHFLIVVAEALKHCSPEETFKLKKLVYELVKLNPKNSKHLSLLHIASTKESSDLVKNHTLNSFPTSSVVKLLLECGADANALDDDRNSALHLAASNRNNTLLNERNGNERDKIITLLLNHGSHYDACNKLNKTPNDLYKGGKLCNLVNQINYVSLQCLASRVIQKYQIPYRDQLSSKLANFVSMH